MTVLFKITIRSILIALLFLLQQQNVFATGQPIVGVLDGNLNQLQIDSSTTVTDYNYFDTAFLSKVDTPYSVKNIINFRLNESSTLFLRDSFTVSIQVRIYYRNSLTAAYDSVDKVFTVNYDSTKKYQSINSFVFNGAHQVMARILSVTSSVSWNALPAIVLENEMIISPIYKFSCTNSAIDSVSYSTDSLYTQGELYVSWQGVDSADRYDLEWTYVDSSALANGIYGTPSNPSPGLIFNNNATRVTITGTSYMIPLLYDDTGSLFFRVRPVQLKANNAVVAANWSSDYLPKGLGWFNYGGHERKLNWQSTISYAEDGKRKIVVQYYDGSLRNRQTVTKDNTTNTTLVGETLYDNQGRPTIQVLPAPTLSNIIKYSHDFNVAGLNGGAYDPTSIEYSKSLYDTLLSPADYCDKGAPPMDTSSGASKYYSIANPQKDIAYNRFIPDAKGYPFTQTEYEQDNTGRISKQSGVDSTHQIGSGHETTYFYGTPDQTELDALFGTEVGDYTHYFKNMVEDANGQYSVNYVDMHGRTIATALTGQSPAGMQSLNSNIVDTTDEILSSPSSNITNGLVMESQKSLLISSPGNNTFHYDLSPESLQKPDCNNDTVCYDCLYNLEITITDDCDNQKIGGSPIKITKSNFTIGSIDTTCAGATGFSFDTTIYLLAGNYQITKTLTVSTYGEEYYLDSVFMLRNFCKTLQQFIQQEQTAFAAANGGDCTPSCASCTAALGSIDSFRLHYFTGAGVPNSDTAAYRSQVVTAYNNAVTECNNLCNNTSEADAIKDAMLLDVTPPSGQYANPDSSSDKYSIFHVTYNSDSSVVTKPSAYDTSSIVYLNELGQPDSVFDNETQTMVIPQQLSESDFISNFKTSWAAQLLQFHPEYCKLTEYQTHQASLLWDNQFQNINTYADAVSQGYFDPLTGSGGITSNIDPLSLENSGHYYAQLLDSLNNYFNHGGTNISLWTMACVMTECGNSTNSTDTTCLNWCRRNTFNSDSMCTGDLDMAWRNFRQIYLGIKQSIIYADLVATCPTPTAAQLTADNHHPNFYTAADALTQDGITVNIDTSNASSVESSTQEAISSNEQANCQSYVTQWIQQLSPCNYSQDAINDTIVPMLLTICEKATDASHPYGASSISPDSTNTFNSFEDALNDYNSKHGIANTYTCNAELITAPLPYNLQASNSDLDIWFKPTDCECSTINNLYTQYTINGQSDSSFSAYLKRTANTTMSDNDLNTLRSMCNSPASECKNLATPISLPPALQCGVNEVCATCSQVGILYQSYMQEFGSGNVPKYLAGDSTDTVQLKINQLFANYMNNHLGFAFQYYDYLAFMAQCDSANGRLTDTSSLSLSCDTLQSVLNNFQTFYNGIDFSQIYGNYKITKCAQEVIDALNADIDAQNNPSLNTYNNGYAYAPSSSNFTAKLKSVTYDGSTRNAQVPLSLDCTITNPTYLPTDKPSILDSPVLGVDFIEPNTVLPTELNDKYIAALMGQYDYVYGFFFGMVNGTNGYIIDSSGKAVGNSFGEFSYYGFTPPVNKYLFQDITRYNIVAVDGEDLFLLFKQSPSNGIYDYDTTIDHIQYNLANNLGYDPLYVKPSTIRRVSNLRFATNFIDLSQPQDSSADRLKVTVDYLNGTSGDAYLLGDMYGKINFKEIIDTNLYNPDCKKSFTSYFNTQYNTNYTYSQITALYHQCNTLITDPCETANGPMLCGNSAPLFPNDTLPVVNSCTDSTNFALTTGTDMYNAYSDSLRNVFDSAYRHKCLTAFNYEHFTDVHAVSEYQYTLYYYDQAGNLVKTIPPQGVALQQRQSWYDSVTMARANNVYLPNSANTLATQYRYNTLNQVIAQQSPDGGLSHFWYDILGRLSFSQNAKQQPANEYSYTLYDSIGRITEVGQLVNTTAMSDSISRVPNNLSTWYTAAAASRTQITQTVYDTAYSPFAGSAELNAQNLRNRVAYTSYYNTAADIGPGGQASATYYSYDIEGNVDTLLQDYKQGAMDQNNRFKKIVYNYDLVSGKVNSVAYQPNQPDAFYHNYLYDAENRLINVETSQDSINWDNDAFYQYYKHGPLARAVIGQQQVQGIDYAYTLQGWLKAVNPIVTGAGFNHTGDDGSSTTIVPGDEYHFSLNYFNNDYSAIGTGVGSPTANVATQLSGDNRPLYNGNISSMAVAITQLNQPLLYNYQYDQLNRLVQMDAWRADSTFSTLSKLNDFHEKVTYNANGNILSYLRNGNNTFAGKPLGMDSLTYNYNANNNQLNYVQDAVAGGNYTEDIDNQSSNNYHYDAIGNITQDIKENIDSINWTVYGKIDSIHKTDGTSIKYTYDPSGNRISKVVHPPSGDGGGIYYVRDASGNVMSVYTTNSNINSGKLTQTEVDLYGSSRLGLLNTNINVQQAVPAERTYLPNLIDSGTNSSFTRGLKQYELTNHLGNVLVTISDKKKIVLADSSSIAGSCIAGTGVTVLNEDSRDITIPSYTASQDVYLLNGFISNYGDNYVAYIDSTLTPCVQPDTLVTGNYYKADVITAGDYYPFGMKMPGREFFRDSAHYRYGFNGQEKSDEIAPNTTTAEFWEYDSRLGRRFNIDPIFNDAISPYTTMDNNPIYFIDPSGDEARDNTKDKHPKRNKRTKHNKDNTTGTQEIINPDGTFTGTTNVKTLKEIVVEGKRHTSLADHSALSVFNQTPQQRIANKKWSTQNITYRLKREDGLSPEDAGSGLPSDNIDSYERDYQATVSWKQGELFWVGVGVTPLVVGEAVGSGAISYLTTNTPGALKYLFGFSRASWLTRGSIAAGDAAYQYYTNRSINPIQTGAAGLLGPGAYSLSTFTRFNWILAGQGHQPLSISNDASVRNVLIVTIFSIMGDKGGAMFDEGGVGPAAGVLGVMSGNAADQTKYMLSSH
jgi:RHS repeat-associated protein